MSVFKCKMCGGTIEFEQGATVGVCDSCGTKQTLPRLDDDRRANLYDRANHFRRNNEFDKAAAIYEQILTEDTTDAEAYWSLVLCRYGIEYVEDPATRKRVPTVNRAQFTSIFDDDNYKSALQYADSYQRTIYEAEAKAINEIQKGILAISQKEEPFDVFICYKETDNNGRRTPDSVLANDLYHQLTQEGFKVFFARITLEDKLGSAYEPYIFAALNSAKVMVVLGTKPEFFNAVWVKNEWSRYLALIKQGQKKMLIPAYKDMDPYDLPEEFSHLQAQDMSKLGFMQDLIRGIKKIAQADAPKTTVVKETVVTSTNSNVAPLLKRAFMFLEDGDWERADDFCEQVLNQDPENAQAYLCKLMAELHVKKQDKLKDQAETFDNSNNYQKSIRFADEKLKTELVGYIEHINTRNENTRVEGIYNHAKNVMSSAISEEKYAEAAHLFESIKYYRDSSDLMDECYKKAEVCRKDAIYQNAISEANVLSVASVTHAIKLFQSVSGWRDADDQIAQCEAKLPELRKKEKNERIERERKAEEKRKRDQKKKKLIIVCASVLAGIIALAILISEISHITKKATLQNSFDNGTFSAEFVKENYGTLYAEKYAYAVIEKEFEKCRKNNDAKKALYYIYELSETGFVFEWWSKSAAERPSIFFSYSYGQWLLDYARKNGKNIETQIEQEVYLDYYSYSIDGYSVTFEKNSSNNVCGINILTSSGWYDEIRVVDGDGDIFSVNYCIE